MLTGRQVVEWMAYAEVEPFGDHYEEARLGFIAAKIINMTGWFKKTFQVYDFMPFRGKSEDNVAERLKAALKQLPERKRKVRR